MKKIFFITVLNYFLAANLLAQEKSNLNNKMLNLVKEGSTKELLFTKDNVNIDGSKIFEIYQDEFELGVDDSFLLFKTIKNSELPLPPSSSELKINPNFLTGIHYKYQQKYKNIPVEYAVYIVHEMNGRVVSANGNLVTGINMNVEPQITKEEALQLALNELNSAQYFWENEFLENQLKKSSNDPNKSYFPQGKLILTRLTKEFSPKNYKLAYKFEVYAIEDYKTKAVYVDAITGEIIHKKPLVHNCNPTTCETIWNGDRNINTESVLFSENFKLQDDCDGALLNKAVIDVMDWGGTSTIAGEEPETVSNITSSDNTWNNNDNQQFGGSVLWAIKRSYWYFKSNFSRDSYDNSNGNVSAYINAWFNNDGTAYNNNATMGNGFMKIGRGGNVDDGPLTNSFGTLDIVAHEYTHAVIRNAADLEYQGESGALNESFADIFGEMTEHHTYSNWGGGIGTNDWLIGSERDNGAIRSMEDPSILDDPDTYQGSDWANTCEECSDYGGVHTNSGVQNKWFYLLSEGGSGTNDNNDQYNVPSIFTNQKEIAAYVAYMNLIAYLDPSSDYEEARSGSILAASDAYGSCSDVAILVGKAWHAVGVGTQYTDYISCLDIIPTSGDIASGGILSATYGGSCNVNITPNNSGNIGIGAEEFVRLRPGVLIDPSGSGYAIINNTVYECPVYVTYPSSP